MKLTQPRLWHVLLLLPLAALFIWVSRQGRATREDPASVMHALRASRGPVLPSPDMAGFASRTEPVRYDKESLYEYIDGAAETFITNGFSECLASNYTLTSPAATALEISAEAYRFNQAAGARQQIDVERPSSAQPVSGLTSAFSDGSVFLLIEGRDLLKLTVLTPNPTAPQALLALATAWKKEMQQ